MESERIVTELDSEDEFLIINKQSRKQGRASLKRKSWRRNPFVTILLLAFGAFMVGQLRWRKGVVLAEKGNINNEDNALVQKKMKPILYVHFHKSGGTTACKLMGGHNATNATRGENMNASGSSAPNRMELPKNLSLGRGASRLRHNGSTSVNPRPKRAGNCNVPPIGPNFAVSVSQAEQNCMHLENYAEKHPEKSYLAIEVPLTEPLPCNRGAFRSMAIMRDPVQRALSHLSAHKVRQQVALLWIKRKMPCPRDGYMHGYPVMNNMITRQLLGRDRYNDTMTAIDDGDFDRAKEIMDQFDVFVPLEYLSYTQVQEVLKREVPEYYERFRDHGGESFVANKAKDEKKIYTTDSFEQLLEKENTYDRKLYDYMLQKLGINERR